MTQRWAKRVLQTVQNENQKENKRKRKTRRRDNSCGLLSDLWRTERGVEGLYRSIYQVPGTTSKHRERFGWGIDQLLNSKQKLNTLKSTVTFR